MRFFLACCPPYWVLCLLLLPSARSKVACSSQALELEVPQVVPGGLLGTATLTEPLLPRACVLTPTPPGVLALARGPGCV